MKLFLFLCFAALFFVSCFTQKKSDVNFSRMKFSFKSPVTIIDGKGISDTIDIYITAKGEIKLYELPFKESYIDSGQLIFEKTRFEKFICDTSSLGFIIKNFNDELINPVNSDSVLERRAYFGGKRDLVDLDSFVLNKKSNLADGKFVVKYNSNYSLYDSAYFYFDNNFSKSDFVISRILEKKFNSKLYKIEMFIKHDAGLEKDPNFKGFFINKIEISKDAIQNLDSISTLFKRYEELKN
jgi:hypothetical protein